MQYLTYILIAAAGVAGYGSFHPLAVIVFALASTLLLMSARRSAMKAEPHRQSANMILDGAYLFAVQLLIMFLVYCIGWFLANRVTVPSI